jgi:hypothetical protein
MPANSTGGADALTVALACATFTSGGVWRPRVRRITVISALAISTFVLLLDISQCLAQGQGNNAKAAASLAARLPPNYRQLMAEYIRKRSRYVVRDAMISTPYERWGGLFRGGTFVAVCFVISRDNLFGIVVEDYWVLTVEDGKVKPVGMGMESCSPRSPFPELKQRQQT